MHIKNHLIRDLSEWRSHILSKLMSCAYPCTFAKNQFNPLFQWAGDVPSHPTRLLSQKMYVYCNNIAFLWELELTLSSLILSFGRGKFSRIEGMHRRPTKQCFNIFTEFHNVCTISHIFSNALRILVMVYFMCAYHSIRLFVEEQHS